ncbi:MAG: thioredoxin domain-containing protein [Deltaproteobacteria bacterium]|nr:thioredoxin domain-containing protein [Deltaproteobacteria bacterium]
MDRRFAVSILGVLVGCTVDATPPLRSAESEALAQLSARVAALELSLARRGDEAPARAAAAPTPARAKSGLTRPDPEKVYTVPTDGNASVGPTDAAVTIVVASDYACPFCRRSRDTVKTLQQEYGDDVRVVAKPLVLHEDTATIPALAACAAGKQGKFFEMEDEIWASGWVPNDQGRPMPDNLGRDAMITMASTLGLDMGTFESDMDGGACKDEIAHERALLFSMDVRGTPTFFINGRYLGGAQPVGTFRAMIDRERAVASAGHNGEGGA